nr:unnamed protein product [Digitaria exilis]
MAAVGPGSRLRGWVRVERVVGWVEFSRSCTRGGGRRRGLPARREGGAPVRRLLSLGVSLASWSRGQKRLRQSTRKNNSLGHMQQAPASLLDEKCPAWRMSSLVRKEMVPALAAVPKLLWPDALPRT